jgi:hypothetical protein
MTAVKDNSPMALSFLMTRRPVGVLRGTREKQIRDTWTIAVAVPDLSLICSRALGRFEPAHL